MFSKLNNHLLMFVIACSFMPMSLQAEEQIIEIEKTSAVRLYADYTFGDCCDLDSISAGTSLITVGTCGTMGGYCSSGKRVAVWNFELPELPENAVLISATFKGMHNAGNTPVYYRGQWHPDATLDYSRASYTYSYGAMVGTANSSGNMFSTPLQMELLNGQWTDKYLVLTAYNSSGMSFWNTGSLAPKISLVIDVPDDLCVGDMNDDGSVDTDDVLHVIANWGASYDVNDLMTVLENWGSSCN